MTLLTERIKHLIWTYFLGLPDPVIMQELKDFKEDQRKLKEKISEGFEKLKTDLILYKDDIPVDLASSKKFFEIIAKEMNEKYVKVESHFPHFKTQLAMKFQPEELAPLFDAFKKINNTMKMYQTNLRNDLEKFKAMILDVANGISGAVDKLENHLIDCMSKFKSGFIHIKMEFGGAKIELLKLFKVLPADFFK